MSFSNPDSHNKLSENTLNFKELKVNVEAMREVLFLIDSYPILRTYFQYKHNDMFIFTICRDCKDQNLVIKFQPSYTEFEYGSNKLKISQLNWINSTQSLMIIRCILANFNKIIYWDDIKRLKTIDLPTVKKLFNEIFKKMIITILKEGFDGPTYKLLIKLFDLDLNG